jgi:hypothetical protein
MAKDRRRPISDLLDEAAEHYRRVQIFEAADVGYRRGGATTDPDLQAWENALADGIPS